MRRGRSRGVSEEPLKESASASTRGNRGRGARAGTSRSRGKGKGKAKAKEGSGEDGEDADGEEMGSNEVKVKLEVEEEQFRVGTPTINEEGTEEMVDAPTIEGNESGRTEENQEEDSSKEEDLLKVSSEEEVKLQELDEIGNGAPLSDIPEQESMNEAEGEETVEEGDMRIQEDPLLKESKENEDVEGSRKDVTELDKAVEESSGEKEDKMNEMGRESPGKAETGNEDSVTQEENETKDLDDLFGDDSRIDEEVEKEVGMEVDEQNPQEFSTTTEPHQSSEPIKLDSKPSSPVDVALEEPPPGPSTDYPSKPTDSSSPSPPKEPINSSLPTSPHSTTTHVEPLEPGETPTTSIDSISTTKPSEPLKSPSPSPSAPALSSHPSDPLGPSPSPLAVLASTPIPSKRSPPLLSLTNSEGSTSKAASGISMPPSLQTLSPKDVRRRFNGHKITCVGMLNNELIKIAGELVLQKPIDMREYSPYVFFLVSFIFGDCARELTSMEKSRLLERLQSNLKYLAAMADQHHKKDNVRRTSCPFLSVAD